MIKLNTFDAQLQSVKIKRNGGRVVPPSPARRREMRRNTLNRNRSSDAQVGFTFAVIALASHVMKSDGQISRLKFTQFFDAFPMPAHEVEKARALLMRMIKDAPMTSPYVRQIIDLFPQREEVYGEVVSRLLNIAAAEHEIDAKDEAYLYDIAKQFGVSDVRWQVMLSRYGLNIEKKNPYDILGISRHASNEVLKTRYRILSRKYHPDNHVSDARSASKASWLNDKMAQVNRAYEMIMRERGLKKAAA